MFGKCLQNIWRNVWKIFLKIFGKYWKVLKKCLENIKKILRRYSENDFKIIEKFKNKKGNNWNIKKALRKELKYQENNKKITKILGKY